MIVMPTILARSCSYAWDCYHVESPTFLDPIIIMYNGPQEIMYHAHGPKVIIHPRIITDSPPCFTI